MQGERRLQVQEKNMIPVEEGSKILVEEVEAW